MSRRVFVPVIIIICALILTGCKKAQYTVINEDEKKGVAGKASTVITEQMIRDGLFDEPGREDTSKASDTDKPASSEQSDSSAAQTEKADKKEKFTGTGQVVNGQSGNMMDMLKAMGMSEDDFYEFAALSYQAAALAKEQPAFPEDSSEYSGQLAMQVLSYNCGSDRDNSVSMLTGAGYQIAAEAHYDKSYSDASHNCAYLIAVKQIEYRGEERPLILTVIRGTNGGEWYSNFDIAPSRSNNPQCAENFLMAAQDVFRGLDEVAESFENPVFLITGHSRGAAAANLLGVMADAKYGTEDVYTYTFATPATITDEFPEGDYSNIFNVINRSDIVPMMPLSSWGFKRAGTDIIITSDEDSVPRVEAAVSELGSLAPDVESYYGSRHSLSKAGLGGDGLTPYEFMSIFAQYLAGDITDKSNENSAYNSMASVVSPESDFAPLIGLINKMTSGESKVMFAHIPSTYLKVMKTMASDIQ